MQNELGFSTEGSTACVPLHLVPLIFVSSVGHVTCKADTMPIILLLPIKLFGFIISMLAEKKKISACLLPRLLFGLHCYSISLPVHSHFVTLPFRGVDSKGPPQYASGILNSILESAFHRTQLITSNQYFKGSKKNNIML